MRKKLDEAELVRLSDALLKKRHPNAKVISRRLRQKGGKRVVEYGVKLSLADLVALPESINNLADRLQPKDEAYCLKHLLLELSCLHVGVMKLPYCKLTAVQGGVIPLPQTSILKIGGRLACSDTSEWRTILANEVLLYLASAYHYGHAQAVADAREWCAKYSLPEPDWLRAAPRKVKLQGWDYEEQQEQFWTDLIRFLTVHVADEEIQAERDSGRPRNRKIEQDRNRYWRTKRLLAGTWADTTQDPDKESTKGIENSYRRFKDHRDSYYFDPATLMKYVKKQAPFFHEILS